MQGLNKIMIVYNGKTMEMVELAILCDKYKEALQEIMEYEPTGEGAKDMYLAAKEALEDEQY